MSFTKDIERFARKVATAEDKIVRTATLELFRGVILATPVKTGRARGAWTTSVGAPAASPDRVDQVALVAGGGGSVAVAEVYAKTPPGAGQVTFLANDLPYIERLESGSSKQAPAGMVKINIDRVKKMVDAAIRANKV